MLFRSLVGTARYARLVVFSRQPLYSRWMLLVDRRFLASRSNIEGRKPFQSLLNDTHVASPFEDPSRTRTKVKGFEVWRPVSEMECAAAGRDLLKQSFSSAEARTDPVETMDGHSIGEKETATSNTLEEVAQARLAASKNETVADEVLIGASSLGGSTWSTTEETTLKKGFWKTLHQKLGTEIDENASDAEKRRQKMARNTKIGSIFLFSSMSVGFVWFCFYYGRSKRDAEGKIVKDEFSGSLLAPLYRIVKSFKDWRDYITEPSREVLLPDPLPPPYLQPKYTLVIEMKNILISPEWSYKTGHRFKKRPALDYFLDIVGYPNFEVVIYTSESSMTAQPVIDSFDPKGRIMFRLFRDCTKYMNGHHVKDLSRLNRDLSKVIFIDFDPKSFQLNPENVLRVPKWEGDVDDTSLVDLAELLKTIYLSEVEDVRPTLQYYSQFDDPPKEFRKRAIYLAEQERAQQQQRAESEHSILKRYSGRLFGFQRHANA